MFYNRGKLRENYIYHINIVTNLLTKTFILCLLPKFMGLQNFLIPTDKQIFLESSCCGV